MLNSVILMGRLTRNPELKQTNSGTMVCSFSIAVDNGYGDNKKTDFINCVAWKGTAEFVSKYFTKGHMIALSGRLSTRSWDDNGTTRYVTEVVAREVDFCGSKTEGQSNHYGQSNAAPSTNYAPEVNQGLDGFTMVEEDDLPFYGVVV